jgi:hypothetical protein
MPVPTASIFDYSVVDADTASLAKAAADMIRSRTTGMVESIIATGSDLIAIKNRLRGRFTEWLAVEFAWTDRTAQNFMRAAEAFGANPKLVSGLPPAMIYKLAAKSTAETIRGTVIDALERGEHIDRRKFEAEIAAARARAREDRREAKLSDKTRRARKRKREEDAAARAKREDRKRAVELTADAKARELIAEFNAATVRRILEAVDDWDVGPALPPRAVRGAVMTRCSRPARKATVGIDALIGSVACRAAG